VPLLELLTGTECEGRPRVPQIAPPSAGERGIRVQPVVVACLRSNSRLNRSGGNDWVAFSERIRIRERTTVTIGHLKDRLTEGAPGIATQLDGAHPLELRFSVSPFLEGGDAGRILASGAVEAATPLELCIVLEANGYLCSRYRRR
jgi:hypothetical protein